MWKGGRRGLPTVPLTVVPAAGPATRRRVAAEGRSDPERCSPDQPPPRRRGRAAALLAVAGAAGVVLVAAGQLRSPARPPPRAAAGAAEVLRHDPAAADHDPAAADHDPAAADDDPALPLLSAALRRRHRPPPARRPVREAAPQPTTQHPSQRRFAVGDAVRVLRSSGAWTDASIQRFDGKTYEVTWEQGGRGGMVKRVSVEAAQQSLRFADGSPGVPPDSSPVVQDVGDGDAAPSDLPSFESLDQRIRETVPKSCSERGRGRPDTPNACWGPPAPAEYEDLAEKTGCDLFSVPFDAGRDAACLRYVSNVDNWAEIKPGAQRYDERTVKFKVTYKDPRIRGIVKVRQRLFPNEAVSEVGSYHADRVMRVNRVPVTAWVHAPLEELVNAVHRDGPRMEMIPQFARDSKVHSFVEWVRKDFVEYSRSSGYVRKRDGVETVGVSVQLFIPDVRPLLDSDYRIPWVAHNDSWQRNPFDPRHTIGFVRQSELAMFDYVLGNGDRSPNKNNFVVGACSRPSRCGKGPRFPGPPNFLTLDNGIMFMYALDGPRTADGPNPLLKPSFCLFERKLLSRLQEIAAAGDTAFADEMTARLPDSIRKVIGRRNLEKCDGRIRKTLAQLERCLRKYPKHRVVFS
eukprot:TRINITY_DN5493_c0_g1_i2.p1 TRINITY_DN5493_c0_g1~~TRINITY_DN5493_c0_g1_i2.p1  ORF type:complete len:631 (+),score=199.12 TRINITY_DN5493_c0_g1_i2:67-1959(+)